MKCKLHPEVEAAGMCSYSGKPYCEPCLVDVDGKNYGKEHLSAVMAEMKETTNGGPTVFMNAGGGGGGSSSSSAAVGGTQGAMVGRKNKVVAAVIAFFFGGIGGHHFYLGNLGLGALYLLMCWTFIPAVIALFEAFSYVLMSDSAFAARYG